MLVKLDKEIEAFMPDENGEGIDESNRTITLGPGEYEVIDLNFAGIHILDADGVNWIIRDN